MKKSKKIVKKPSKPAKSFHITLEIEFTGAKKGADERLLNWLLSKDSGTMPEDFLSVKVTKSVETELSKAYAKARANSRQDTKLEEQRQKEERKTVRLQKREENAKRKVTRKKAGKRAKEQ